VTTATAARIAEIATQTGTSERTARRWVRLPGFPIDGSQADVRRWVRDMRAAARARQSAAIQRPRSQRHRELDQRLKAIRIELDRLKLEKARAAFHDVGTCRAQHAAFVQQVHNDLMKMAKLLPPLLVGRSVYEMEEIIELHCEHLCNSNATGRDPWAPDNPVGSLHNLPWPDDD
jgi:hypothetical protein